MEFGCSSVPRRKRIGIGRLTSTPEPINACSSLHSFPFFLQGLFCLLLTLLNRIFLALSSSSFLLSDSLILPSYPCVAFPLFSGRWFLAFPLPFMGMVGLPPHIEDAVGMGQVQRLVRGRLFIRVSRQPDFHPKGLASGVRIRGAPVVRERAGARSLTCAGVKSPLPPSSLLGWFCSLCLHEL